MAYHRSDKSAEGMSGIKYDRWSYEQGTPGGNDTAINKLQHKFWVTKQAVARKLGKNEDEHIIASDSELDAKLELFKSICETTSSLQRMIEHHQDRLCNLSYEENCLGRFLKEYGKADKTRGGKLMVAVGKTMGYSGQQRLTIRVPLVRLYQEVETFRQRAIDDTMTTVRRMEKARTQYRGALAWMKNVSQELDPDTYKQLEKFRKVQGHVKDSKARFDSLKLDSLQKIDLLAASRCNMFSHALIIYQDALITFWEKTAKTMNHVNESFKGYQQYEFSYIKELAQAKPEGDLQDARQENKKNQVAMKESPEADHSTDVLLDLDTDTREEPDNFGNLPSLKPQEPLPKPSDSESALLLEELTSAQPSINAMGLAWETNEPNKMNMSGVESHASSFMPSQMLDSSQGFQQEQETEQMSSGGMNSATTHESQKLTEQPASGTEKTRSMNQWFQLFADLDPLANPDAVGKSAQDKEEDCYG